MPANSDDLKFILEIEPDTAAFEKAVADLGKQLHDTATKTEKDFKAAFLSFGMDDARTQKMLAAFKEAQGLANVFDKMRTPMTALDGQMQAFKGLWQDINKEAARLLDVESRLEA